MKREAALFVKRRDASFLRTTFDLWAIAERGRLLVRVRDTRLVQQNWAEWHVKLGSTHRMDGKQNFLRCLYATLLVSFSETTMVRLGAGSRELSQGEL